MTSISAPILFFGTEDFSLISLQALVEAGFSIGAVITKPDFRSGRGQKLTAPRVKVYAQQQEIPVWQPEKLTDIIPDIQAFKNPVGVLVSYGKIIPTKVIELFSPGIINLHPSLLPRYRGPSPLESAIANQDETTGISIMKLEAKMDAGPVYFQEVVALNGSEDQLSISESLGQLGAQKLVELLPDIVSGLLQPVAQDESLATYCSLLKKSDAHVEPHRLTASQLEATIRAHIVFPKTKLTVGKQSIIVTKAHVDQKPNTPLDVRCRDGAFLIVDELVAPSGKKMSAHSFLNGYAAD